MKLIAGDPIVIETDSWIDKAFAAIEWMFTDKVGLTIVCSALVALFVMKIWKALPKGVLAVLVIIVLVAIGVLKANVGGR